MNENELSALLRESHEREVQQEPPRHSQRTPNCPSIPEFTAALETESPPWQRDHVIGCDYCQKLMLFEWRLHPPGVWTLAQFMAGVLPDRKAMSQYLAENPAFAKLQESILLGQLAEAIAAAPRGADALAALQDAIRPEPWFLPDFSARAFARSSEPSMEDSLKRLRHWADRLALGSTSAEAVSTPDRRLTLNVSAQSDQLNIRAVSPAIENSGRRVLVEIISIEGGTIRQELDLDEDEANGYAIAEIAVTQPKAEALLAESTLVATWLTLSTGFLAINHQQPSCPPIEDLKGLNWSPELTVHIERCNRCQDSIAELWRGKCPPKAVLLTYMSSRKEFPANRAMEKHLTVDNCDRCGGVVNRVNLFGLPLSMRLRRLWSRLRLAIGMGRQVGLSYPLTFEAAAQLAFTARHEVRDDTAHGEITQAMDDTVHIDLGRKHGLYENATLEIYSRWTNENVGLLIIRDVNEHSATGKVVGPYPPRIGDAVVFERGRQCF
jgi:hypothetical protein